MVVNKDYVFFWGDVFSNFFPCKFTIDGITFTSSEQYFMYKKAEQFGDVEIMAKILMTNEPGEAKAYGRQVRNYDDKVWDAKRFDIMCEALFHKFTSSHELRNCLQLTFGKKIVEASPYDKIWGIGLFEENPDIFDEEKWDGQNLLGKALEATRDKIFNESKKIYFFDKN